jgi:2-isopropylmalate synthase
MARIHVYDTTLRDGSQGEGVSFSLQDKLLVTQKLDDLGVDFVEGGYPLSNPKDAEYFVEAKKLPLRHARVVAFGMTRKKNTRAEDDACLRALLAAETAVVTLVGKTWDMHVTEVLGTTLEENLRMIADSVGLLKQAGREVFYDAEHFFDGFRHNTEYAVQTLRTAQDAGASVVILCDTNGGTLPEEIAERVEKVRRALRVEIGIHCHNDGDLATANTLAAVARGATQVQGTVNGLGERCGNADLVSVVANLALKRGHDVLKPGSVARLTELSRYVYEMANMNFRPGQPFVGQSAFAHKGGMHAQGVARNTASYEHIDPATVGNARRILVSELAGQSSILAKLKKAGIEGDRALAAQVLERVQDLENEGYEFEAADASFDLLVLKLAGQYRPRFERLAYRVNIEAGPLTPTPLPASGERGLPASPLSPLAGRGVGGEGIVTEATVKVKVGGEVRHTVSEGDGPVNALDGALRKALAEFWPNLGRLHLVDYKVRVANARAESAARVRVVIEWRFNGDAVFGTVGVSENVVEASWLALQDAFEYKWLQEATV